MQFVGPTFEPVAELPYFGLRFFGDQEVGTPEKKAHEIDTHAGKCHESFTFLIAELRNAEFPISMAIAIDLYLVLYSHTRQLARYVRTPRRISLV